MEHTCAEAGGLVARGPGRLLLTSFVFSVIEETKFCKAAPEDILSVIHG